MYALNIDDTIVLNKTQKIPEKGIICAHPNRVQRIINEFLEDPKEHTNYRGYQVYTGLYKGEEVFAANTGIGAPAAAFLLEELKTFGAKKIIRVGSNDTLENHHSLSLVKRTTLPLGLLDNYGLSSNFGQVEIEPLIRRSIKKTARNMGLEIKDKRNRHIDGYYSVNFLKQNKYKYSSADMESGALYLLGHLYKLFYGAILLNYPKHGVSHECYGQSKTRRLEAQGISLALESLRAS